MAAVGTNPLTQFTPNHGCRVGLQAIVFRLNTIHSKDPQNRIPPRYPSTDRCPADTMIATGTVGYPQTPTFPIKFPKSSRHDRPIPQRGPVHLQPSTLARRASRVNPQAVNLGKIG
jgi:hypothetical protein